MGGEAITLPCNSFLLGRATGVIQLDESAKKQQSRIIPKLRPRMEAGLQVAQIDSQNLNECHGFLYYQQKQVPFCRSYRSLKTDLWWTYNYGPGSPKGIWLFSDVNDTSVEVLTVQNLKPYYKQQHAAYITLTN